MHRPTHGTVVAYLALFVALGGTAYAATGGTFVLGHSNAANKLTTLKNTGTSAALRLQTNNTSTPPLIVSNGTKIKHLNADKVDGLNGSSFQTKTTPVQADISSAVAGPQPAGTAGPWTFTYTCSGSGATFTVTGPGTIGGTTSLAAGAAKADTYVGAPTSIGGGSSSGIATNAQMSRTVFLQNGSTTVKLTILMSATNGGLFEICSLNGDALRVS